MQQKRTTTTAPRRIGSREEEEEKKKAKKKQKFNLDTVTVEWGGREKGNVAWKRHVYISLTIFKHLLSIFTALWAQDTRRNCRKVSSNF